MQSLSLLCLTLLLFLLSPDSAHAVDGAPGSAHRVLNERLDTVRVRGTSRPLGVRTARSAELIHVARQSLFDYRLPAAVDSFRALQAQPDGRMAAYHGFLWVELLRGFITEEPTYFTRFDAYADTLESIVEERVDQGGESRWTRHVEAERRWMMALVEGRRGNYLSAAWKARGARSRLADLQEAYPDFADPLMAFGLTRVAVATLPRSYRFVLRILGFRGDTDGGRENLDRAARESETNRYPARAAQALLDLVLFENDTKGTDQLRRLHEDTPESLLSAYLLTFALTEQRAIQEAREILQTAREQANAPGYAHLDYLDYFYGYVRFVENDFAEAADAFASYVTTHAGDALRAQALLYRGWALEMSVGWDAARPVYQSIDVFRDFDADRWAARWGGRRAVSPMSAADSTLLLSRTAFDAARTDEAEMHARSVLYGETLGRTTDNRAEAAYRLGRIYHVEGPARLALAHYREAIRLRGDEQSKWAPYALYYTGRIHAEQGNIDDARDAFERAVNWPTPYDFSDGLEQMASHAKDQL